MVNLTLCVFITTKLQVQQISLQPYLAVYRRNGFLYMKKSQNIYTYRTHSFVIWCHHLVLACMHAAAQTARSSCFASVLQLYTTSIYHSSIYKRLYCVLHMYTQICYFVTYFYFLSSYSSIELRPLQTFLGLDHSFSFPLPLKMFSSLFFCAYFSLCLVELFFCLCLAGRIYLHF